MAEPTVRGARTTGNARTGRAPAGLAETKADLLVPTPVVTDARNQPEMPTAEWELPKPKEASASTGPYEDRTVADLRKLASERGIKGASKMKKATLVRELRK